MSIKLSINDLTPGESIAAAILHACAVDDEIASGTIGPSFACSGPGSGWQVDYDVTDYAERALSDSEEYGGALGYIDADDGRMASLDDDGNVEWTDESVVELTAPDDDEIDQDRELVALMLEALEKGQCIEGDGDWDRVRALYNVTQEKVLDQLGGEIHDEWIVYYDEDSDRWCLIDIAYLVELRALMGSSDEETADGAYAHWHAEFPHEGKYENYEEAIAATETEEGS